MDLAASAAILGRRFGPVAGSDPSLCRQRIAAGIRNGLLLFLPFLIIDIVVASVLMSLGMMMLPPSAVSLPFKLIFFVLIDGWRLVAGSLVQSFRQRMTQGKRVKER